MYINSQAESFIACCKYENIAGNANETFFKFLVYSNHCFGPGWEWQKQEAYGSKKKRQHTTTEEKCE